MLEDTQSIIKDTRQTSLLLYIFKFLGVIIVLTIAIFVVHHLFDRRINQLKCVKTATDAYDRMRYLACEGELGAFNHETPREFGHRLIKYLPGQEENVNSVVQAFVSVKYRPRKELEEPNVVSLQKAWVRLCPPLVKCIPFLRRWSLLRPIQWPR